jgi:exopolysaccharide biosynthesis polyprenyl glycosylphosphotransferase
MTSFRRALLCKLFSLFDLVIMGVSFTFAAVAESYLTTSVSFVAFLSMRIKLQNILILLVMLAIWHGVLSAFGLYESKRLETRQNEVGDVVSATSLGTLVLVVIGFLFRVRMVTPGFLVTFWLSSTLISVFTRLLLRLILARIRLRGRNLRRILIVGTNQRAVRFAESIKNKPELGYELVGFVDDEWSGREEFRATGYPIVANCELFAQLLREHVVDEVVLALPMKSCYQQAWRIATQSQEQGVIVRLLTCVFDLGPRDSRIGDIGLEAAVAVSAYPAEGWPSVIKRVLDVVISATGLIFLIPLFLITAILIRRDSPGSIFFAQERVGINKRRFRMFKLRTMTMNAEKMQAELENRNEVDGPVFKIRDDPRVTRFGKFLRKTSIDELPQLYNVLKGDMSLVGPRPLPVRDYQGFTQDPQRRRFSVRPGITCLWQVNGRSAIPFDHWMDLDLQYIEQWSLWLDFKILVKTIPAVLKGDGAA